VIIEWVREGDGWQVVAEDRDRPFLSTPGPWTGFMEFEDADAFRERFERQIEARAASPWR